MALHVETEGRMDDGLKTRLSEAVRDVTKLRGDVLWVTPGGLANDGKVIEDARSYQ
jgi:phenylacetate-CoA ligase